MQKPLNQKNRLKVLDYLRGFFIIVIIVDHLSRWPSIFSAISGKAWLWVTAAEGFVAISGLLVGYVRGYKNRDLPLKTVSGKLIRRALLLYLWSIIATIVYTVIIWYVPLRGGAPGLPIATGDWFSLIWQSVTMQYTQVWVHFLTLYAIFLAAAPLAIWLLRIHRPLLVALISFAILLIGWKLQNEAMQWQFLFFMPAILGYHLETVMSWWRHMAKPKRRIYIGIILGMTALTMTASVIATFYPSLAPDWSASLNTLFEKDTISLWRAGVAFIWFGGLVVLFGLFFKPISKSLGWLLEPIGTHSLTAYILHGLALVAISAVFVTVDNLLINSLFGAASILLVWGMLKIPHINRVVPR